MKSRPTIGDAIFCLKNGGVGIIPTDTVYGIVGNAFFPEATQRIYFLKNRDARKPFVILISSIEDLKKFGINPGIKALGILQKVWPNEVSVILSCRQKRFFHLHRGRKSLAFRIPGNKKILDLIRKTGPLASSSANLSGQPVALNIREAKDYFKDQVDFYINGGQLSPLASTIIRLHNGKIYIQRRGRINVRELIRSR